MSTASVITMTGHRTVDRKTSGWVGDDLMPLLVMKLADRPAAPQGDLWVIVSSNQPVPFNTLWISDVLRSDRPALLAYRGQFSTVALT